MPLFAKMDEFLEKVQLAFDPFPPPLFRNYSVQIFDKHTLITETFAQRRQKIRPRFKTKISPQNKNIAKNWFRNDPPPPPSDFTCP